MKFGGGFPDLEEESRGNKNAEQGYKIYEVYAEFPCFSCIRSIISPVHLFFCSEFLRESAISRESTRCGKGIKMK